MNKAYRLIWSRVKEAWVVVSEKVTGKGGPRAATVTLSAALLLAAGSAAALPTGSQIVSGTAGIVTSGNTMTVTNSAGAIINWQAFSIASGETTRFIQPSAVSAVLNRVTGGDPSKILGTLQSNGKVLLINPSGIIFGAGARVDVNGLIASSLDIANKDFLAGRMKFTAGAVAGKVENQGTITTPSGGSVYLIAPDVQNSGVITAPNGDVLLAAGKEVLLVDSANPEIAMVITAPDGQSINLGTIIADAGRVGMYGSVVRQKGRISADSAVQDASGRIFLKATKEVTLEKDSVTSATGTNGGTVQVLGQHVGLLDNAVVDVSGTRGGGTVLIGGDYQGKNSLVLNAEATYMGKDAVIKADATDNGNGGKVILWADNTTRAYGSISAKGGLQSGDGGFVETSGKSYLDVNGIRVNTLASGGKIGRWLLDPADITIDNSSDSYSPGIFSAGVFSGGGTTSTITWSTINSNILSSSLEIQTYSLAGSGSGNININAGTTLTGIGSLTLLANNNITFAPSVAVVGASDINLVSGWNNSGWAVTSGTGNISFGSGSSLSTTGNVSLSAGNSVSQLADASITANKLSINGDMGGGTKLPGGVSLLGTNMVNTLAVDINTAASGVLTFNNSKTLTIGTAGSFSGIAASSNTSAINITTTAGDLIISKPITSSGIVTLTAANNITVSSTGSIQTNTANLTATAGAISYDDAATALSASTANLNAVTGIYGSTPTNPLKTYSGGALTINATNTGTGPIRISDSSYSGLTVGTGGVAQSGTGELINISTSTGMGDLSINGPVTSNGGDITFFSARDIYVNADISATGVTAKTLTLQANNNIIVDSGVHIFGDMGNPLNVTLQSAYNQDIVGAVAMLASSSIYSYGGNIYLGGYNPMYSAGGNGSYPDGVSLLSATINSGAGNISINGTGVYNTVANSGIKIDTTSHLISTSGNITLSGSGGNGSNSANKYGIHLQGSIQSTSGAISLGGSGGGNNDQGYGVFLDNGTITTATGLGISISGYGGQAGGSANIGVKLDGGSISTTAAPITITGNTFNTNSGNTNHGVFLGGGTTGLTISSGSGAITIDGTAGGNTTGAEGIWAVAGAGAPINITSSGSAPISLTGAGTLAAPSMHIDGGDGHITIGDALANSNISFTAGGTVEDINIGINVTVQGTGNLFLKPLTPATTIGLGAGAGTFNLTAAELASFANGFANITIGSATQASQITVDNVIFNDNLTLLAPTAGGAISIIGALSSTGNNITLNSAGAVTPTAPITAAGLELLGSGSYTLTNVGNVITTLAGNTTNTVDYHNAGPLTIGTVNSVGLTAGNVSLTTTGALTDSAGATITTNNLTINSTGGIVLDANHAVSNFSVSNTTSGGITFVNTKPTLTIGTVTQSGTLPVTIENTGNISLGLIDGGGYVVTLRAHTGAITDYNGTADNVINAFRTDFNDGSTFTPTGVGTVGDALEIYNAASDSKVTAQTNSGGIYIEKTAGTYAVDLQGITHTGNATGDIVIKSNAGIKNSAGLVTSAGNNGNVTLQSVGGSGFIAVNAPINKGGTGTLTLQSYTGANVDIASNIFGNAGDVVINAGSNINVTTGGISGNNLVFNAGNSITDPGVITANTLKVSAGSNVSLTGANMVNIFAVAPMSSGNLDFYNNESLTIGTASGTNGIDFSNNSGGTIIIKTTTGDLTVAQQVTTKPTGGGQVTLDAAGTLNVDNAITTPSSIRLWSHAGGITSTAAGIISGNLEAKTFSTGNISLGQADNVVPVLSASVANGGLSFKNSGNLDVGYAIGFSGVTASGDVSLLAGGAITQTYPIIAAGLELLGSGSYTLTNSGNIITTLAGNTTGPVTFYNAGSLAIGTVNSVGLTSSNNITLTATGAITQSQKLSGTTLTAKTVNNSGASITLSNAANDVATVNLLSRNAADLADAAGDISYRDSNSFDLASAHTTGNVTLKNGGAVTQSGTILAAGLELRGSGSYTLTNTGNVITTLAGDPTGVINFYNAGALDIGTVNTVGLTSSNTIALTATGAITQSQKLSGTTLTAKTVNNSGASITLGNAANDVATVNLQSRNAADSADAAGNISYRDSNSFDLASAHTTGNVTLQSDGAITQTGDIKAVGLVIRALGDVALDTVANSVSNIAAQIGDGTHLNKNVRFKNSGNLNVGTVDGVAGITTQISGIYNSGSPDGVIALTSGGNITQSAGALLAGKAVYAKAATVNLQEANTTGVIAGEATGGSFQYKSSNGIFVTTVNGASGIQNTGSGGDVILTSVSGGISQDQPISTKNAVGGGGFGVSLTSTGSVILQNSGNNFAKLAANTGSGFLALSDGTDLTVGIVGALTGITTINNYVDIQVPSANSVTVSSPINVGTGVNAIIKLMGGGIVYSAASSSGETIAFLSTDSAQGITLGSGSVLGSLTDTKSIELVTDKLTLPGTPGDAKAQVSNALITNEINIKPHTANTTIGIGAGGTLNITDTSSAAFNAPTLVIGTKNGDPNPAGVIAVNAPVSRAGGRLALLTGAGITQGTGSAITVSDLAVIAGGAIGLNGTTNTVSNLAIETSTGAIDFVNSGVLTITSITGGIVNPTTITGIKSTAGGNVSVSSTGGIILAAPVVTDTTASTVTLSTSSGSITDSTAGASVIAKALDASAYSCIGAVATPIKTQVSDLLASSTFGDVYINNSGPLTISTLTAAGAISLENIGGITISGSVLASTGDIAITAHSPITITNTGIVDAETGNVTLTAGLAGSASAADAVTIDGSVSAGGGITLAGNSVAGTNVPVGAIIQTSSFSQPELLTHTGDLISAIDTAIITNPVAPEGLLLVALAPQSNETAGNGTDKEKDSETDKKKKKKDGQEQQPAGGDKKDDTPKKKYCN